MNLTNLMKTEAGWGMTVLRIVTGIVFIGHGAPKFGFIGERNLAGTAGFLESIGVPLPMVSAFLVAFFETFGGAFLVIGLLTRFWSAGLAFAMLIAVTMVHLSNGMFGEGGYQWALVLMACSLALMFEGAGKASLDRKFGN
ncbi:MAG TPA: DoxX family protein [Xanthomonadales bacterium]|nr:DoxX family protein [Xanthomonadales bacterium]